MKKKKTILAPHLDANYYTRNRLGIAAKVGMALGLITMTTACGTIMDSRYDVTFMATEEGMDAWSDYQNGLVTNAKAPDDADDTPYYELQRQKERGRTERYRSRYQGTTSGNIKKASTRAARPQGGR